MTLKDLGSKMVKWETPVAVKDIKGNFLCERIHENGCCGEKELIKLEAYTLMSHLIVVHLDLDVLDLKPVDAIFHLMLAENPNTRNFSNAPIMWTELPIPPKINAIFTWDCKCLCYSWQCLCLIFIVLNACHRMADNMVPPAQKCKSAVQEHAGMVAFKRFYESD